MFIQVIRFVSDELLYAGHLQSLSGAGIVLCAAVFLGDPVTIGLVGTPYLILQAIYWYDRYRTFAADAKTNQVRSAHQRRYRKVVPLLSATFLLLAAYVLIVFSTPSAILFSIIIAVLGLLYPVYFKGLTRSIPLFKNFYVSAVFAILALYPTFYVGSEVIFPREFLLLPFLVFGQALAMQIILDLKDVASDREQRLRTLPVLVGNTGALWSVVWLTAIVVFVLFIASYQLETHWLFMFAALGFALLNAIIVFMLWRQYRQAYLLAAAALLLVPLFLVLPNL